jgi:hypothetical protein
MSRFSESLHKAKVSAYLLSWKMRWLPLVALAVITTNNRTNSLAYALTLGSSVTPLLASFSVK